MKSRTALLLLLLIAVAGGGYLWWSGRGGPPSKGQLGKAAYTHTEAILSHGPRPAGSPGLATVRGYVKAQLEKSGWTVQEQPFKRTTPNGEMPFVNLRARFSKGGTDAWSGSREGLLCAHIDSKGIPGIQFLGADDAASACGAILEIARYLAESKPKQAEALELVFFDGEEAIGENITTLDGIYGSREYIGLWRNAPQKPRFGILLDMIGHKNLKIAMPSDSPEFLKKEVLAAADAEDVRKHFGMARGPIVDDHLPLNMIGIPTIDLIGDFANFPWWHNRDGGKDDLSIISADSLDISMRVVVRTLDQLLGKDAAKK